MRIFICAHLYKCSGPNGVAEDFWLALKLPKRSASAVARVADGTAHLLALASQLPMHMSDINSPTMAANATAFRYSLLTLNSNASALGRTMGAVFDAQVCESYDFFEWDSDPAMRTEVHCTASPKIHC